MLPQRPSVERHGVQARKATLSKSQQAKKMAKNPKEPPKNLLEKVQNLGSFMSGKGGTGEDSELRRSPQTSGP